MVLKSVPTFDTIKSWVNNNADVPNADTVDGKHASDLEIPTGAIIVWSGAVADIPSGWALCDGAGDTPDLTERFVVGAGGSYNVNDTGGSESVTLTTDEIPDHGHNVPAYHNEGNASGFIWGGSNNTNSKATSNTGGGAAHENLPPYLAMAYIMKV